MRSAAARPSSSFVQTCLLFRNLVITTDERIYEMNSPEKWTFNKRPCDEFFKLGSFTFWVPHQFWSKFRKHVSMNLQLKLRVCWSKDVTISLRPRMAVIWFRFLFSVYCLAWAAVISNASKNDKTWKNF